jgi:hypothetical protein
MAGVSKSPLTPALERARALIASGDLGPAQVLLERAVELGRENLGEDEPDVLTAQRELAGVFLRSDDPMAARRMLEDAYAAGQWKLGDSDPVMLHISHDLGVVAQELGNKHEARKAFGRVAANGPAVLGEGHQFVGRARAYLGEDPSAATVRPEPAPAIGHPSPSTHPSSAVVPPPAPAVGAQPAPVEPVQVAQPVPAEPVQVAQAVPVDRVSPVPGEHSGHGGQRPVVEGVQGHDEQGRPDPRAAIDRPTDVFPIARPWEGTPQPSGLSDQRQATTDQNQSSGTGEPPAQPQPGPPAIHRRPGYSQAGQVPDQQGYTTAQPGYDTAPSGPVAGHAVPQPGHATYPPGQAGFASGQSGYPPGPAGFPPAQAGHAAAPPAYPVGQPGYPAYPQPDGHGATMPPAYPQPDGHGATMPPGWQGAPHPGWQGAPNPAQQGMPNPVQQGVPNLAQGAPGQGWPGAAVQTYPYPADNGAPAHPYQRKGRGLAVGLTVAATLVALTAVGALVVVLVDREQPPAAPQATASAGPVLAGDPPSAVRLDDRGAVVELTWRDPTRGKVPFVVTMARAGQQLKPVSNVGLGKTEALVEGLNAKLEYCFAVVAVYGTDRFASSGQVCTERS